MLLQPEQPADSEEQPCRTAQVTPNDTVEELTRRIAEQERELKEWFECTDDLPERRLGFKRGLDGKLVGEAASRARTHPELVTVEPWPDGGEVYGEALPVVADWRRALRALEQPPHTLAWLGATERLLMLEVQLIDDRRLTLPPDESPWDDVRRDTELQLREHRLRELRRRRLWTEPLHWAARVVTLGRFGAEEELGRQMQREFEERRAEVLSSIGEHKNE